MRILSKKGIVDRPGKRRNHKNPTPRGGGIAVIITIISGLIFSIINGGFGLQSEHWPVIAAASVLAIISWIDDIKPLPALLRLAVHAICSFAIIFHYKITILGGMLPENIDMAISAMMLAWFINLYNFMDGIDTITGAETLIICAGIISISYIFMLPSDMAVYAAIIAAATLGFLFWNCHPAKIFLGDVGSVTLGFLLGFLLLKLANIGYWQAAIILPLYYLADSGITIIKRFVQGKKIWEAHSEHFYQQAVRLGKKHNTVVKIISAFNIALLVIAILLSAHKEYSAIGLLASILLVSLLLRILKKEQN